MSNLNLNNLQIGTIATIANLAANVVNMAIVRPTGNNPTTGINGFVFDIWGPEEVRLQNEITDHYVEDNYAVQDHVATKPLMITLKGFVGELVNILPNTILSFLAPIPVLDTIIEFSPVFTQQAIESYELISAAADSLTNYLAQAQSINSILSNSTTTATRQQDAFTKLQGMSDNRQICDVETPFGVFHSMLIMDVTPVQPEESSSYSEFTVTFKQIRIVSTQTIPAATNNPVGSGSIKPITALPSGSQLNGPSTLSYADTSLGRYSNNLNPVNNLGQTSGENTDISTLGTAFNLSLQGAAS